MTPLHTAHIIRTGAIHRAIRQILGHRPAVSRTIRETGSSLAQIIERTGSIAEASRHSGRCPATVRKYKNEYFGEE